MAKLEIIALIIFGLMAISGLAVFALYRGDNTVESNVRLLIWGTVPRGIVDDTVNTLVSNGQVGYDTIDYVFKDEDTFRVDFVNELASGRGPDLVILPHEELLYQSERIFKVPYSSYPLGNFRKTFIRSSEIFLGKDGITALPYLADPLILYYNEDIKVKTLSRSIPKTWNEIFDYTDLIIERDKFDITQQLIAFGGINNVPQIKEILSALIQQTGNNIVTTDKDGDFVDILGEDVDVAKVVDFYTEFSNPLKSAYTWNESFSDPLTEFINGNLYLYVGFASEVDDIRKANPALNFKVALLPQIKGNVRPSTFVRLYGIAIPNSSKNLIAALNAVFSFTGNSSAENILANSRFTHTLQGSQPKGDASTFSKITYDSSFIGVNWYDIEPESTFNIFKEMIASVVNRGTNTDTSIERASRQIGEIVK